MTGDEVRSTIVAGMARAFFASAYASLCDERGRSLTGEIMDQLPDQVDPAALQAADTLAHGLERAHGAPLAELYAAHSVGLDPDAWGHYAAMQAMGHGVGLTDYGMPRTFRVPDVEFSDLHLSGNYILPDDPPAWGEVLHLDAERFTYVSEVADVYRGAPWRVYDRDGEEFRNVRRAPERDDATGRRAWEVGP